MTKLDFVSINDIYTNSSTSSPLIKQYLDDKAKNQKIYKSKIQLECSVQTVIQYLKTYENRFKFNKYLKDAVILKENFLDSKSNILYEIYDFKALTSLRDFILMENYREVRITN